MRDGSTRGWRSDASDAQEAMGGFGINKIRKKP